MASRGGGEGGRHFHRAFTEKTTSLRTASPTAVAVAAIRRCTLLAEPRATLSPRAAYGMSCKIAEINRPASERRSTIDASSRLPLFRDRSVPMTRPVYPIPNKNVRGEFSLAARRMEGGARYPCGVVCCWLARAAEASRAALTLLAACRLTVSGGFRS